jgi:hypothetical protein
LAWQRRYEQIAHVVRHKKMFGINNLYEISREYIDKGSRSVAGDIHLSEEYNNLLVSQSLNMGFHELSH